VARTKKVGVLHSVYFRTKGELERVKRAAKLGGMKLSVLMRDAILDKAERVLGRGKRKAA
jgi:uncharacterized protein (DUF1778 family)